MHVHAADQQTLRRSLHFRVQRGVAWLLGVLLLSPFGERMGRRRDGSEPMGRGNLNDSLAEVLDRVWIDQERELRGDEDLYSGFRRILRRTATTGNALALDLEQRVSEGG